VSDAPRHTDVRTAAGQVRVLTWGPEDAPMALCLHGFPDTAYGWRLIAPLLVAAGYRVVAPFMRGYHPSTLPDDGAANIEALVDDALRVRAAMGAGDRDVLIGHDWGALTASGIAALTDRPFAKIVIMSVPPPAAFRRPGRLTDRTALLSRMPMQLIRSSYTMYFQLPWAPEHSRRWVVPLLWRRWSPGYDAAEDLRYVDAAIGAKDNWRAALATYRATLRNSKVAPRYHAFADCWLADPVVPVLYLHGADDGCMSVDFARWVGPVLPQGSKTAVIADAGHFLQLEQPDTVAAHILDFVGA